MAISASQSVTAELIDVFTRKAKSRQAELQETRPDLPAIMRRGAHPKHHGLVRALFTVNESVPSHLRHGLFAQPRVYPAYVRFSNSGSGMDDREPDAHGMAIKLLDVPGRKLLADERATHDFVLVDSPVFIARDPEDFLAFMRLAGEIAAAKQTLSQATGQRAAEAEDASQEQLALLVKQLGERFSNVGRLKKAIANPLFVPYFSQTAYRLGSELEVKYQMRPKRVDTVALSTTVIDSMPNPINYLSETMAQTLDAEEVDYDFMLQIGDGSDDMPSEDPTVEWPESKSPFIPVATLSIPRQKFSWPQQRAFAENISFNPWHALNAHQPIGRINDARRDVYSAMLKKRHDENHVNPHEPTGVNDF